MVEIGPTAIKRLIPAAPCRKTHDCRQAASQAIGATPFCTWYMRQTLSLCPIVREPESGGFPSPTKKGREVTLSVNRGIP